MADLARAPVPDTGLYVLQLIREGLTPEEIITRGLVRMSLLDLTRMVRALQPDTRTLAKSRIDSAALALVDDVIEDGRPSDKVALLKGRGVLMDEPSSGITIIIGGSGHDITLG